MKNKTIYQIFSLILLQEIKCKELEEYTYEEMYIYLKYKRRMTNFKVVYNKEYDCYTYEPKEFKENPTIITSWEELSKLKSVGDFSIRVNFKYYSGDLLYKGKYFKYLTTHFLYKENEEYSEKLLRCYGFNVKIIGY